MGAATAREFAAQGATLILADLDRAGAERVADGLLIGVVGEVSHEEALAHGVGYGGSKFERTGHKGRPRVALAPRE